MEKKVDEVPQEEKANIIKDELFEEKQNSRPNNTVRETLLDNKIPLLVEALDSLETKNSEMKKKPRFSISLSPEEIEEDILLMTGSKPLKKPRKRGEAVQRELDKLFPGMRFASRSLDASHYGVRSQSSSPMSNYVEACLEKEEEENKAMVDKVED
ncbi:hypothetical protein LguiB_011034 [Lonicera macranthoides]